MEKEGDRRKGGKWMGKEWGKNGERRGYGRGNDGEEIGGSEQKRRKGGNGKINGKSKEREGKRMWR